MFKLLKLEKQIDVRGIYTFFYFEHDSNFKFVGEKHDFWEMVYVDSGEIYEVSDSIGYILSQGDVIFHQPMEFHSLAAVNNKPHNVLIVTFSTKSEAMSFFAKKIFTVNLNQKKILSKILSEFKNAFGTNYSNTNTGIELTSEQACAYQIGTAHLEHFLLELLRENNSVGRREKENSLAKKNVKNAIVDAMREYMAENVCKNLTLNDICAHFNMSKSYLTQLFKLETGSGIIDYFIDLKIKEAKFLIREGDLNFTQIAERLGYTSLQHFTRIFKQREKMSPTLYEKSIKQ